MKTFARPNILLLYTDQQRTDSLGCYGNRFDTQILSDEPGCYDDMVSRVRTMLPPAAFHHGKPSYSAQGRNTHEPYLFEGDEDMTHSAFVASEICRFLESRRGEPFFAIAGFYAPHPPINPPKRFVDMCDPGRMPRRGHFLAGAASIA